MHRIRSKTTSFLLVLIIDEKVAKTDTSFLAVSDKYLHNGPFCYSYNT